MEAVEAYAGENIEIFGHLDLVLDIGRANVEVRVPAPRRRIKVVVEEDRSVNRRSPERSRQPSRPVERIVETRDVSSRKRPLIAKLRTHEQRVADVGSHSEFIGQVRLVEDIASWRRREVTVELRDAHRRDRDRA